MTRQNPKIKVEKEPIDWLLEFLGILAVAFLVLYPLYHYAGLPDRIPTHYGPDGTPDAYGSKSSIWTMPMICIPMYIVLFVLNRSPHIFNFPTKITEENAAAQYQIATRLIRSLNTLIAGFFAYITYGTVQTALGTQSGLGTYALGAFLALTFGIVGYYLLQSFQKKSN